MANLLASKSMKGGIRDKEVRFYIVKDKTKIKPKESVRSTCVFFWCKCVCIMLYHIYWCVCVWY